jgi:hypothetical protein
MFEQILHEQQIKNHHDPYGKNRKIWKNKKYQFHHSPA